MSDSESKTGEKKLITIKNTADLQRLKIEKLMKNPDKPVVIPERPKQKALAPPPDFVRNVMGSSAGAGSGEFHVYRHLRRKEYARQKFIQEKSEKEKLDEEYHMKIQLNKKAADEKTAKKRAKRLRKKNNAKLKGKKQKSTQNQQSVSSHSDSSSEEDEKEGKVLSPLILHNSSIIEGNNEKIQEILDESQKCNSDSKAENSKNQSVGKNSDATSDNDETSEKVEEISIDQTQAPHNDKKSEEMSN